MSSGGEMAGGRAWGEYKEGRRERGGREDARGEKEEVSGSERGEREVVTVSLHVPMA